MQTATCHPSQAKFAKPLLAIGEFIDFPESEVEQAIPQRLAAQVARFAEKLAVSTRHHELTYRQLDELSDRCARALLARRGEREEPIAVLLGNEAPTIAAFLGILKAGKMYVPIDPALPAARVAWMIEDAGAPLLVTDVAHRDLAREALAGNTPVLELDELANGRSLDGALPELSPDRLAWILYTSGSTGKPKGVVQNHRNLLHFSRNTIRLQRLSAADRIGMFFSFAANAAPFEMLAALLAGASLHPLDVKREGVTGLAAWLAQEAVTIYSSVPTVFRHFLETLDGHEDLSCVRLVKQVGEAVRPDDVARFRRHFPATCVLANRLGSTETATVRCYFIDAQTPVPEDNVPVGYAIDHDEVLLCDESGNESGPGEVGEIVVRSRYLTPGYWRRPELNAAVFQPALDGSGLRTYRTGDLGRMLPDGCLLHLGRKDFQVKIRGHRVELGEIEAALRNSGGIHEAVVTARPDEAGDPRLVAYLVCSAEQPPTVSALRRRLATVLPDYMVPSVFVQLDDLPRASNGKVDRSGLLEPEAARLLVEAAYQAPQTTLQISLAALWEELLGVQPIGVHDDFFEKGGHSLLGMQMLDRLEQRYLSRPPVSLLFTEPTIARFARWLIENKPATAYSQWIPLRSGGSRQPFWYLHGDFHGAGLNCLELARHLPAEQPLFVFPPHGLDDADVPLTIEGMARDCLAKLRALQPQGPYCLGGHCNGALVAFEMARQLHEQGQAIALLVLFEATVHETLFRKPARGFDALFYQHLYPPQSKTPCRNLTGRSSHERNNDLWEIYKTAYDHYFLHPWPGKVTVFCAESNPDAQRDPSLGWKDVMPEVEVHVVPGNHTSSLSLHAPAVAHRLNRCLERAAMNGHKAS